MWETNSDKDGEPFKYFVSIYRFLVDSLKFSEIFVLATFISNLFISFQRIKSRALHSWCNDYTPAEQLNEELLFR